MLVALLLTESLSYDFARAGKYMITNTAISHFLATPLVLNATISTQQEYLDGSFQVTGTTFDSCAAVFDMWQTGTGGAIFAQNGFLSIQDCGFTNNAATYAGAVMTANTLTTIINSKFTGNVAKSDAGSIWSLAIEEDMTDSAKYKLTLNGGNFTKNKASMYYSRYIMAGSGHSFLMSHSPPLLVQQRAANFFSNETQTPAEPNHNSVPQHQTFSNS